ncbi:hypothetical protein BMS3Abin17_00745 [archaeon BMS3Abin17]|nr:hypothetical protein BMS3Abin17_00745 [archaeon BMS3Abin17]
MLLIILFSIFGGFLIVGGEPSGEGRALEENLKNVTGDLDNLGIVEEEIYIDLGEIEDFEENISIGKDEGVVIDSEENNSVGEEIYIDLGEIEDFEENISVEDFERNSTTTENNSEEDNQVINSTENNKVINSTEPVSESKGGGEPAYLSLEEVVNESLEENMTEEEAITNQDYSDETEIAYVFYRGGKKEIETKIKKGEEIDISKEEFISEEDKTWKKDVKIYSKEHFGKPVTVYSDIIEDKNNNIRLYWKEEDRYLDFQTYDENGNGIIDRISWTVPHLSEQNFEIIVEINGIEDTNYSAIIIEIINFPNPNEVIINNTSPVNFSFNIFYNNIASVICNFSLEGPNGKEISNITNISRIEYSIDLSNGDYSWILNCYDENEPSIKNSSSGSFSISVDYPPEINFYVDNSNINEGDSVTFYIDISTLVNNDIFYVIDYNDGFVGYTPSQTTNKINVTLNHIYNTAGNYIATLIIYVNNVPYNKNITITVSDVSDREPPSITLIEPSNNEIIDDESIIFSYRPGDNVKISNCTLNVYYYNGSLIGSLVYSKFNDDVENNEKISLSLTDFDLGDYSWGVECYDNSSNYIERVRDFNLIKSIGGSISTKINGSLIMNALNSNSEEVTEINYLLSKINEFFIKEEAYGVEEKEAIQDLEILKDLKSYKKRLLQMRLDLEHNLDFMGDGEKRENRKEEILEGVNGIKGKIPSEIRVIDDYEYYKNSAELDMEGVVDAYIEAKEIVVRGNVKSIIRENERIQDKISTLSKAKQVELTYERGVEKITLVTKKIEFKEDVSGSIIEVIPKEIAETNDSIYFINKNRLIKADPIFEIEFADLIENKSIYYIKKFVDLNNIEKTDTILFREGASENSLGYLTGFVTFLDIGEVENIWFYISWIIMGVIIFVIVVVVIKKSKIRKMKENKEVAKIFNLSEEISTALKNKELERAKDKYHEAKEVYHEVPEQIKDFVYKKLEKLYIEIGKGDLKELIREFITASEDKRKEDALLIYNNIKKIYPHMGKKNKKRIYKKLQPYLKSLNGKKS